MSIIVYALLINLFTVSAVLAISFAYINGVGFFARRKYQKRKALNY